MTGPDEALPGPVRERTRRREFELSGQRADRSTDDRTGDRTTAAGSSEDPIGALHRSAGNRAVGAALSGARVASPDSPAEREAERVASQVVSGSTPAPVTREASAGTVHRQPDGEAERERDRAVAETLARQSGGETRPQAAEYREAAKETARALRGTEFGRRLERSGKEMGEAFWATLAGKVATLSLAGGGVTGFAIADEELPVQAPTFPADAVIPGVEVPGLSVGVTYEGRMRQPSKVMLTFTYGPGGGGGGSTTATGETGGETGGPGETDLFRFRQSLKSAETLDAERRALWEAVGGVPAELLSVLPPARGSGAGESGDDGADGGDEGERGT